MCGNTLYLPFYQSAHKLSNNFIVPMSVRESILFMCILKIWVSCSYIAFISIYLQYSWHLHCVPTRSDEISSHNWQQQPRVVHHCDLDTLCFTTGSKHLLLHCYWQHWVCNWHAQFACSNISQSVQWDAWILSVVNGFVVILMRQ